MSCDQRIHVLCFAMCLLSVVALSKTHQNYYTFEDYKVNFKRDYVNGSSEHQLREAIFRNRMEEIRTHNAGRHPWKKGVNHLTDLTDDELGVRNGYKGSTRSRSSVSAGSSILEMQEVACSSHEASCVRSDSACCDDLVCGAEGKCVQKKQNPPEFDWTPQLKTAHRVLEQGRCGSCWALAATAALQFSAEIVTKNRFQQVLSPEGMLGCTPNEQGCGGQGGCKGATAELAYDWVASQGPERGVPTIDAQPYNAKAECQKNSSFLQMRSPPGVSLMGWKKLKENDGQSIMESLVNVGPLVASIAANGLHGYHEGVVDKTNGNLIVNHAVVMMGYGEDNSMLDTHEPKSVGIKYWKLRNSWGPDWGEHGFFRIQRFYPDEKEPCGYDTNPGKGVVCKNADGKYPEKQWVCGVFGSFIDTAYPVGTTVHPSLLDMTVYPDGTVRREPSADAASTLAETGSGDWCKTQCEHFEFTELAAVYENKDGKGADFGSDVSRCELTCDKLHQSLSEVAAESRSVARQQR